MTATGRGWARSCRWANPRPVHAPAAKPLNQDDALWQIAKDLLRKAGQLSGPDLLDQLEGLTGSAAAGKRLLVRLRHCADVKVASGGDTPLYRWIEARAAKDREPAAAPTRQRISPVGACRASELRSFSDR